MDDSVQNSIIKTAEIITNGKYKSPLHILELEKIILASFEGKFKRIIVNLPPRHGKSELISKYLPYWYLGNFPDNRIILSCYSAALAKTFGRKVMQMIDEFGKKTFDIELNPKSRSAERFDILQKQGGMDSLGALGAITGKGADLLIIDDPVKNDAQANSAKMRDNLWDWFMSTALTRLEPKGVLILVMTRWHEDDICGRIISSQNVTYYKKNKDFKNIDWLIVKIPAIAEPNDPLGRAIGTPLWEDRYNYNALEEIRLTIGSRWFGSLYQQSPSPADGAIFRRKYFRYFSEDTEYYYMLTPGENEGRIVRNKIHCRVFAVADLALSTKETADYTVIIVFAATAENDVLILDVIRERFEGAKHIDLIKQIFELYDPVVMGIESVQYQKTLIQSCMNIGLRVSELKPRDDKQTRALPMQAKLEAGKVYFKKSAVWLEVFEKELLQFPNAKHDDQVDAFAYIAYILSSTSDNNPIGKRLRGFNAKNTCKNFLA